MIYTIIRIILGLLFVVSGWVKAVDPMGTSYKIADYAVAFNIEWIGSFATPLAILLCSVELFIGLMLIFRLWEKVISCITFLFMFFFTVVTFLLVVIPDISVKECGCFGDAITLTNMETFLKNIIFLTLSFFYVRNIHLKLMGGNMRYYYNAFVMSKRKRSQLKIFRLFVYLYVLLFSIAVPTYSAYNLPPYTHLSFDIGTNLRDMKVPAEESKTELIYKNIETGEHKTFNIEDQEWHNEEKWEYVDTKISGIDNHLSLSKLTLYNKNNEDVTDEIIESNGYTFIVVAQDIKELNKSDVEGMNSLYRMSQADKVRFMVATTSPAEVSKIIIDSYGWYNVEIYNSDIVELKSVLRSRKGLILISDGVIAGKWNLRQNTFKNISYNDIKLLINWGENTIIVYFIVLSLFVAIMLYFVKKYHKSGR